MVGDEGRESVTQAVVKEEVKDEESELQDHGESKAGFILFALPAQLPPCLLTKLACSRVLCCLLPPPRLRRSTALGRNQSLAGSQGKNIGSNYFLRQLLAPVFTEFPSGQ
ncbi:hypothetical protein Fcan01_07876 [Folsomia candida]|uniref:Uncharacterized protein n=1 Tax=Folsomia candida TaxID=158441 RepID=A0A226EKE4_FOLCA|nr:hypothetical protein Fcan01_07876 [Folsomia candida]